MQDAVAVSACFRFDRLVVALLVLSRLLEEAVSMTSALEDVLSLSPRFDLDLDWLAERAVLRPEAVGLDELSALVPVVAVRFDLR